MSAQYDVARPAKQVYTMDTGRLRTATKTSSYLPSHHSSSSRRVPVESASLPHNSWLSNATEFNAAPLSQAYHGIGISASGTNSLLSSGSLSDCGTSPPVHRTRSRDLLHSTSPTYGTSTRSRHSPSPIPSPERRLHPSRSFTALSPHKTSALSSDRDASSHLDLKRLMSKPAKQTPSGSISLPSDSERSADASSYRVLDSRRPSEGAISRPPLSRSANASREKLSLHVNTTGLRSSSASRIGHTSSPDSRPPMSESQSDKPARTVLRRRSSARSISGGHAGGHSRVPTDELSTPGRKPSAKVHVHDDAPFAAYTRRPTTSPSGGRPATSPRSRTKSSKSPQGPSSLTPAGAVALAYKQQEQRREELVVTASYNEAYRPASTQPVRSSPDYPYDDEDGAGGVPYYTVFGGASGRLVAVGSQEDVDLLYHDSRVIGSGNIASHGAPSTGTRSLSRKISLSGFKRTKREQSPRELPTTPSDEWKSYHGSSAGHDRHIPTFAKGARKPLALDISSKKNSPQGSPVTKPSPAPKSSASPQEDRRMTRSSKGRDRDEEASPGGKWWKLMKRISTGGLRDKFQQDEAPPPVPALPQNVLPDTTSRTTMDISSRGNNDIEVSENGVLLRRFMQSRASMSGVRPVLPPPSKASSGSSRPSSGTAGRPSTGNTMKSRASISISGHRPSTATRSSSPSSEKASSAFFSHANRTASTRSSFSSFGEEVPPVPKNVGQYIISPSELSRITKYPVHPSPSQAPQSKRSQMQSRSQTAPAEVTSLKGVSSPEDRNTLSLPLPPRRAGGVPSPLSPSFNVEDTVNNLMPPQPYAPPPLTEFGMKEPPPRPKRSSRRSAPLNVEVPTRSQSMSATATMPLSPQTPHGPPQVRVNVDLIRRPSTGALSYASTAKQVSGVSSDLPASALSSSTSPSSAVSQKRSPLTFRELESPRQKLTEKEKADKWDDLLARSARAGGTLHLGEMHLLSDNAETEDGASFRGYDSDL